MSYDPSWDNGNDDGRIDAGVHAVCLSDPQEISDAINRRLSLTYQGEQDVSSKIYSGAYVRRSPISVDTSPPFNNLRYALAQKVLHPPFGSGGGVPPTPTSMYWLWPVADGDQNKILVNDGTGVDPGEVGLFAKLNGTNHWTNPTLTPGVTDVRAVHFNELRQAVEWISRGRWKMPIYCSRGIFSILPDNPWASEAIANNGSDEVRSLGFCEMRVGDKGLSDCTVRSTSRIELYTDLNCSVGVYHCLRPLDFLNTPNFPTWNEYLPEHSWASPGGLGGGDSNSIGSISCTAYQWCGLSGSGLQSALQAMIDGAEQNFLLRRTDTGPYTVGVTGRLTIDFDLDSPPN